MGEAMVVVCHCMTNWLSTLLDESKRLALHAPERVRARFAAGVCAVPKSLEVDRLILDSRPSNLLEPPLRRWIRSLASAESLTRLTLPPGHNLYMFGNDLRDFYYMFHVSEERSRRNILVGSVKPWEVERLG